MKGENDFYFPQSQPVKTQLRNVNRVKPGSPGNLTFFFRETREDPGKYSIRDLTATEGALFTTEK